MQVIVRFKAKGPGRGWWGPPKGTHGTEKTGGAAKKAGTAPNPFLVRDKKAEAYLNDGLGGSYESATAQERSAMKQKGLQRNAELLTGKTEEEIEDLWGEPGFDEAEQRLRNANYDVYHTVSGWSSSSNDHDMRALGLQEAAAKEFGVPTSDFVKERKAEMNKRKAAAQDALRSAFPTASESHREGMLDASFFPLKTKEFSQQTILRGMYDRTQADLSSRGMDSVTLYRGVNLDRRLATGSIVEARGNPLESWSTSYIVASEFASSRSGGNVLKMTVPRELIVSTPKTGMGCLTEGEFVILGSSPGNMARVVDRG